MSNTHENKKIFSINAYKDNRSPKELETIIQAANPDILLIMEMTEDLHKALAGTLQNYRYVLASNVRDGFKICLFSKHPLSDEKVSYHGPDDTPLLHASTQINGKTFRLFSAHPKPALNAQWYKDRHTYFQEIEQIISNENTPVIVMGDFNSVPWEGHFSRFLENTNLKSTVEGCGYKVTWPVFFPILGIPMDHILISKGVEYFDLSVGPYVGSDHYPIGINI